MMISPDGIFEGPDREIDRHIIDKEFNDNAISTRETFCFTTNPHESCILFFNRDFRYSGNLLKA